MFFCGTMKKSPQDGQAKGDDFMPTMDLVPYDSGIQFGTRYLTKEAAFFLGGAFFLLLSMLRQELIYIGLRLFDTIMVTQRI